MIVVLNLCGIGRSLWSMYLKQCGHDFHNGKGIMIKIRIFNINLSVSSYTEYPTVIPKARVILTRAFSTILEKKEIFGAHKFGIFKRSLYFAFVPVIYLSNTMAYGYIKEDWFKSNIIS